MSASSPRLILASASPRRAELLTALGLSFTVNASDIDETRKPGETPAEMVVRLAGAKAAAVTSEPEAVVIGADTAVVLGDRVMGKPVSREEGIEMLLALAAGTHEVLTGVAVVAAGGQASTELSRTQVRFRDISRAEADNYWHSDEPKDKAGGYAIQGRGGVFVESLSGSYSGVVGLPVFETARLLRAAGISIMSSEAHA